MIVKTENDKFMKESDVLSFDLINNMVPMVNEKINSIIPMPKIIIPIRPFPIPAWPSDIGST